MPASLELTVALLDMLAFFLVTPEVLGKERFLMWFAKGGRVNIWIRTVWFNRDLGQMSPSMLALKLTTAIVTPFVILGYVNLPLHYFYVMLFSSILVPAVFTLLYGAIAQLARPLGVIRALAVSGAIIFLLNRALVIASAWSRI